MIGKSTEKDQSMPRPPGFERHDVLQKATQTFWERGYGATSISDLVAATGLQPGSIYAAFGSKKGMFLEVLDEYGSFFLSEVKSTLQSEASSLAAIRAFLEAVAEDTMRQEGARGCLLVNATLEMSQHEPDIAQKLCQHSDKLRLVLLEALSNAQDAGEIPRGSNPEALSIFLVNNLWGMRVMCRNAPSRQSLQAVVDNVMKALAQ